MYRLLEDIKDHRHDALRFLNFWLLVSIINAWMLLALNPGNTLWLPGKIVVVFFSFLVPAVAGYAAASWGASVPLAGVLVSLVDVAFLFACQLIGSLVHPVTEVVGAPWLQPLVLVHGANQVALQIVRYAIVGLVFAYFGALFAPSPIPGVNQHREHDEGGEG